ncbi:hypothetical protein NDI49_24190 [Trichocoleus sp. ST-U3]
MELNPKQPSSDLADVPPLTPGCWTTARLDIRAWLYEQAPSLAELYEGAVCLIFEKPISGRVRFVAHAVREIRNQLPNYISGGNTGGRLEYKDEVEKLSKLWQSNGFSLDEVLPDDGIDIEGSQPSISPDILLPHQLLLEIQQLLKKHEAVSVKNKEKAIRFFETCIPANQPLRDTLRPIAEHWWDVTEWFMQKAHDSGQVDTACDEQKLRQQFELFESFLGALAQSFYTTTDELDEILKEANPQQIDKAVTLLIHPQQRYYFFNRLENPKWIAPLKKKGFFKNPPQAIPDSSESTVSFPAWAESIYLARMAKHDPKAVLEIAKSTETDNPKIHTDFVEAALQMSPEEAVKMVTKVKTWIESPYSSFALLTDKVGALILHFANGGPVKKALELARSLLAVMPDPSTQNGEANEDRVYRPRPKPRTHFDSRPYNWGYEQILKKYVPELVTVAGESALKMLGHRLNDAIKFSQHPGEREEQQEDFPIWDDGSTYWRLAIEEHPRNGDPYEVKELLAIAVRDAAEQIVESDPAKMRSLVLMLEKWHWRVFYRIALYLIRKYPDTDRALLTERLVDQKRFSNSSRHEDYEYVFLAKDYFGDLPKEEQEKILDWIENPNFDLSWSEDQERRAQWVKNWQLNKLTPIKDSLPAKWQQRYQQLVKECGTNVDIPDIVFGGVSGVRILGIESPKTDAELASMSIEKLVSFLRTWQPPSSKDPFKPGPSIAGVGLTLSKLAEQSPERFALEAKQFQGLHPRYAHGVLRGLRNALANSKGQEGILREFSWLSVLKLCHWLVEESIKIRERATTNSDRELNWSEARRAVADLLGVGLTIDSDTGIPFNLRSKVWNTLKPLTQDPDPTPERETRYGGSNMNPSELSINTVRGEAIHTVVRYALWIRRHFEQTADGAKALLRSFDEMPEVRQVLDTHLNPDQEPSLAIRSIYGRWFPWLILLDPNWTTQNVAKIFPEDETLSDLRIAAWESYIIFCSVYDNVFEVLHEEYSYAVEQINATENEKRTQRDPAHYLAQHLMTLYWRGKLSLEQPNGSLTRFFELAPDELRGDSLEFIGRSLRNTNEEIDLQILNQLQILWEQRLDTARKATSAISHASELAAFGWWFVSGKFDDSWAIAQLKEVLELVGKIEPEHLVVKRLAVLANVMPAPAVELLRLLLEGDNRTWRIYGWPDEARTILTTALQGGNDQTRQIAIAVINHLGEQGYLEFRELLSLGQK